MEKYQPNSPTFSFAQGNPNFQIVLKMDFFWKLETKNMNEEKLKIRFTHPSINDQSVPNYTYVFEIFSYMYDEDV